MLVRRLARSIVALGVLATAAGAAAQSDEETRTWARETYARAEDAFARGENDVALALFREIVDRTDNVSVRYNVAVCLERDGRNRDAYAEFRVVSESQAVSADVRAAALEGATRLALSLGTIELDAPEGSRAIVDDELACVIPCEVLVEPGPHRVSLEGDDAVMAEVTIARGQVQSIALERRVAREPTPPVEVEGPSLGWLTAIGVAVAAIGGGGIVGFGLHTSALHDEFQTAPTTDLSDEGFLMRDLTNLSIGVAAAGGVLVLIDLVLFAIGSED
jgi:hypothetical protein